VTFSIFDASVKPGECARVGVKGRHETRHLRENWKDWAHKR
jgi:hypothetical protein